jgi:hypothetical protein
MAQVHHLPTEGRRFDLLTRLSLGSLTILKLFEDIYATGYTGRISLDCVNGVPKRYEVPQPGVTGDLQ